MVVVFHQVVEQGQVLGAWLAAHAAQRLLQLLLLLLEAIVIIKGESHTARVVDLEFIQQRSLVVLMM